MDESRVELWLGFLSTYAHRYVGTPLRKLLDGYLIWSQTLSEKPDYWNRLCKLEQFFFMWWVKISFSSVCAWIGFIHKRMLLTQSCPTLWDTMDCSLRGSSVHGILQARVLDWVTIPFSRGSSRPKDQTQISCIAGRFFTIWATKGSPSITIIVKKCFKRQVLIWSPPNTPFGHRKCPSIIRQQTFAEMAPYLW